MKLTQSLPQHAYSAKQVRENEPKIAKQLNIDMFELMARAGQAVFTALQKNFKKSRSILVICGKGNNGGDGFVVARLAKLSGFQVKLLLLCEERKVQGDALTAMQQYLEVDTGSATNSIVVLDEVQVKNEIANFSGEVIIDAILGTGFKGPLSSLFEHTINAVNVNQANVLSIDIPSGLDADTGAASGQAINAAITVSFIAIKKGLLTGQAANHVGKFYFAGLQVEEVFAQQINSNLCILQNITKPVIPTRKPASHKGNIGLLLTIGGGQGMPGAIRLASEAALRCGASLVATCCHIDNRSLVFNGRPELMLAPSNVADLQSSALVNKAKALVIGPGLGRSEWAKKLFQFAVNLTGKIIVVDADGLYFLAQNPHSNNKRVLTPHPAEAAILLGCSIDDVENDRFAAVNDIAEKYGGICVLKGAGSLISDGKQIWINTSGNAGMASGGMGDVLSGIIAALSLQLDNLFDAVKLGVYLHGYSADIIAKKYGQRGMLASDLFLPLQYSVNPKCIEHND